MATPFQTKPRRSGPPPVSRELSRIMGQLARYSGAMDPRLVEHWPDIAGPQLAGLCRPMRLRRNGRAYSLEVAAASGAAAMQLQFRQRELVERVNKLLGKGTVTRVIIRQTGAAGLAAEKPAYSRPVMPVQGPETIPAAGPAPRTLEESLARLRRLIAAREAGSGG